MAASLVGVLAAAGPDWPYYTVFVLSVAFTVAEVWNTTLGAGYIVG